MSHLLRKLTNYEFWPFWVFYLPFTPLWLYYSIKAKTLVYFCYVNPNIRFGGFVNYSKSEILKSINPQYLPKTIHYNSKKELLNFPFIAKPDLGERGIGVSLINNNKEWLAYPLKHKSLILQEYINYDYEFGVFYVRHPNQEKGKILSITGKEFLVFYGDGKTTLKNFIKNNTRAYYNKEYLFKKFTNQLDYILPKNEKILLEPIGNHNRGTAFTNASHLITQDLENEIDKIAKQIDSFYYGRFDVKAKSIEEFKESNFKIIEVNGANSEPTHIYDKNFNLLSAYKEVYRHLKWQFIIANINIAKAKNHFSSKALAKELIIRIFK